MSASTRRNAVAHARRGNAERSGAVAVTSNRGAKLKGSAPFRFAVEGCGPPYGPIPAVGTARTIGALPWRISIQPSAAICA